MMMGGRSKNSFPFTPSQWQELEHQALIFKYMASGIPIPPDLILPIRRSLLMDSPANPYLPYASTIGWGAYQMGNGRKVEDPEPGRCKRTDGKKWRCSKEACPDSKYCEKHLHRGKSRSRKHVELSLETSNPTSYSHFSSTNFSPLSLPSPQSQSHHFLFPCSSSSGPPPLGVFQHQDNSANFHYRNFFGPKEVINEYPFFKSQVCTSGKEEMSNADELMLSREHLQSTDSNFGLTGKEEREHHYLMLGANEKSEKVVKLEREESQSARPFHCFFDEWPQTQLSIAMPNCDIPVTASQCFNDG